MTRGYVVVGTVKKYFYLSAIHVIETIKAYNPDANVTLFTEERFLDGQEFCADKVEFVSQSQTI